MAYSFQTSPQISKTKTSKRWGLQDTLPTNLLSQLGLGRGELAQDVTSELQVVACDGQRLDDHVRRVALGRQPLHVVHGHVLVAARLAAAALRGRLARHDVHIQALVRI